jgi:hypothetical protein
MKTFKFHFLNFEMTIPTLLFVMLSLLNLSLDANAQNNSPNKINNSNSSTSTLNPIQPPVRVLIDGNQLMNQSSNQPKPRPLPNENLSTAPAPNNVRIGSSGQYSDSNAGKTEQINSSGQLCQTNQGVKKCY